jgi:Asp-tRNA(Asn)/Glu-tRNA(Gln) amidotransferase A subunit family amidase
MEATISDIHAAYRSAELSARQLVQMYLDRIDAYDQKGPSINALISLNPRALEEADRLDSAFAASGPVGPLHGIPIIMKDQGDVAEMPTTLGSVLFEGHMPGRDAFVVDKLKRAGAIFIGKATLGELGAGDTHGSLFGSTRNVYDLARTAGGSSGGSAASVSANFSTLGIGQEGLASIRRPSIWNGIAGMRPTAGLVSRSGVFAGWPSIFGSLGPMARTVTDLAKLLDGMVGYDAADPVTAHGVGRAPASFADLLDADALKGARLGILRQPLGFRSEPGSDDFNKVGEVFDRAVAELERAGATIVDPVEIPGIEEVWTKRASDPDEGELAFNEYFAGSANAPFASRAEAKASPLFEGIYRGAKERWDRSGTAERHYEYLRTRERLMNGLLTVMADHRLDAIVHKAVEHQPTLIAEGVNPPYVDQKGAPALNTFLVFVPSIVVPAGFTGDGLPAGITFLGRAYADADMVRFAYAYEQATHHRQAPTSTP